MQEMDFNSNYCLENETILANNGDSVSLKLFVSSDCSFFDGHFPEFKLMPAVGQFAVVTHLASKYFGLQDGVSKIKRMKFSMPVVPDSYIKIDLSCDTDKKEVSFLISDLQDSDKIYSSGKYS